MREPDERKFVGSSGVKDLLLNRLKKGPQMKQPRAFLRHLRRSLFLAAACLWTAAPPGGAQSTPPVLAENPPAKPPVFDVVSIRPSTAGERDWRLLIDPNGDEYRAIGLPLGVTILFAYFPYAFRRIERDRMSGAPSWIWDDRFDIVAKIAPENIEEWHKSLSHGFGQPNPMLEAMLQAALADRCKLAVHRVPATVPGFALVVANRATNARRFSPTAPDEIIPKNAQPIAENGRLVPILSPDNPALHFYATSTAALAAHLSMSGTPIQDRTGLIGKYDFALTRLNTTGDPSFDWDLPALGLKLQPIKVPAENIAIDHIEHPSPN